MCMWDFKISKCFASSSQDIWVCDFLSFVSIQLHRIWLLWTTGTKPESSRLCPLSNWGRSEYATQNMPLLQINYFKLKLLKGHLVGSGNWLYFGSGHDHGLWDRALVGSLGSPSNRNLLVVKLCSRQGLCFSTRETAQKKRFFGLAPWTNAGNFAAQSEALHCINIAYSWDLWLKLTKDRIFYYVNFLDLCLKSLVEARVVKILFFF